MVEIRDNIATDMSGAGGFGLPQMSEREMFEKLLSPDSDYSVMKNLLLQLILVNKCCI